MESNKHILQWPSGKLDFSEGPVLMGILNVTPDSFSDGGQFFDTKKQ
jgi:dihydropteroate synthase